MFGTEVPARSAAHRLNALRTRGRDAGASRRARRAGVQETAVVGGATLEVDGLARRSLVVAVSATPDSPPVPAALHCLAPHSVPWSFSCASGHRSRSGFVPSGAARSPAR